MQKTILYVHGMGGGGDSRIPSILKEHLHEHQDCPDNVEVIVRTYSFDPEEGREQIKGWVSELKPVLIIGESLGSVQAIRITGLPHIFVSPSLDAPRWFGFLAWLALIPGVTRLCDHIWKPREGDRQKLHFTFRTLHKYPRHLKAALDNTTVKGSTDSFYAFFGAKDHYRKSGTVSVCTYRKYFGDTYQIYEGTHFMEEEYIYSLLIPKIISTIKNEGDL